MSWMKTENEIEYYNLIYRQLNGGLEGADLKKFNELFANDYEFKQMFDQLSTIIVVEELSRNIDNINVDQAIKRFDSFAGNNLSTGSGSNPAETSFLNYFVGGLVSVALISVVGYFLFDGSNHTSSKFIEKETTDKSQELLLDNGIRVYLNKNSKLIYHQNDANSSPEISISGEAYIEMHTKEKPLKVKVGEQKYTLTKGAFNINAYNPDSIVGTVVQGKIMTGKQSFKEGQKAEYISKEINPRISKNENLNYLSWKTDRLTFRDAQLKDVVIQLNKHFDSNIVINSKVPKSCLLTADFGHQTLNEILEILTLTLNIKVQYQKDNIYIFAGGC